MIVQVVHGCFEQTCSESSHVWNSTIYKELFDNLLIGEDFTEPEGEAHIIHDGFLDDTDKVWDLCANASSESHCQGKGNNVLQDL